MNTTLVTALVALVPVSALFSGSAIMFLRERTFSTLLQLLGATCLVIVVVVHVCEAFALFPWMHWGEPHSVGHYLDLASAVLGFTLFPMGYLLHALSKRPPCALQLPSPNNSSRNILVKQRPATSSTPHMAWLLGLAQPIGPLRS